MKTTFRLVRTITYDQHCNRCSGLPLVREDFEVTTVDYASQPLGPPPTDFSELRKPDPPGEPDAFLSRISCLRCKVVYLPSVLYKEAEILTDSAQEEYEARLAKK